MADNRTPESRSALMARIGSKNTAPELLVRRLLFAMGYRFRLHRSDLPGKPDIVFVGRRKAIFVHGCFWHAHGCKIGLAPKSHLEFWQPKLKRNCARDLENERALRGQGWDVLTIWQCETKDCVRLQEKLVAFLGASSIFRSTFPSCAGTLSVKD
ncbi:MAG: very short patch repair endonuclease [Candidatus Korobacteraceae bacterium]